jgi:hypothetical protein
LSRPAPYSASRSAVSEVSTVVAATPRADAGSSPEFHMTTSYAAPAGSGPLGSQWNVTLPLRGEPGAGSSSRGVTTFGDGLDCTRTLLAVGLDRVEVTIGVGAGVSVQVTVGTGLCVSVDAVPLIERGVGSAVGSSEVSVALGATAVSVASTALAIASVAGVGWVQPARASRTATKARGTALWAMTYPDDRIGDRPRKNTTAAYLY